MFQNFKAPRSKPEAIFCIFGLDHPFKNLCCPRHIYQNNFVLNSIKQKICDLYNLCITIIVHLGGNASYDYDFFFTSENKVAINNFGLFFVTYVIGKRN